MVWRRDDLWDALLVLMRMALCGVVVPISSASSLRVAGLFKVSAILPSALSYSSSVLSIRASFICVGSIVFPVFFSIMRGDGLLSLTCKFVMLFLPKRPDAWNGSRSSSLSPFGKEALQRLPLTRSSIYYDNGLFVSLPAVSFKFEGTP